MAVATDHASAQRVRKLLLFIVATAYLRHKGAHIVLGGILVQFGTHTMMQFSFLVSGFIVGHTVVAITYWCLASDFFIRYAFDRPVKVRMSDRVVVGLRTARMIYTLGFSSLILFMRYPFFHRNSKQDLYPLVVLSADSLSLLGLPRAAIIALSLMRCTSTFLKGQWWCSRL